MGEFLASAYQDNNNSANIKNIKENKDKNEDFMRIYSLLENDKHENKFQIPFVFKFLKIEEFFLGLQNLEGIYSRYKEEFEKRNLSKKDSVHASILFSFSDDCKYFLDYFPDNSTEDFIRFYQDNDKGLRYKAMTMEEFIHINSVCIIKLKSDKKMTLFELFEKIYSYNKWRYKDYDLENHNCCHFAKYILELLNSSLLTGNKVNDVIFTKYIENSKKEESILGHIPNIFLTIFHDNIQ